MITKETITKEKAISADLIKQFSKYIVFAGRLAVPLPPLMITVRSVYVKLIVIFFIRYLH